MPLGSIRSAVNISIKSCSAWKLVDNRRLHISTHPRGKKRDDDSETDQTVVYRVRISHLMEMDGKWGAQQQAGRRKGRERGKKDQEEEEEEEDLKKRATCIQPDAFISCGIPSFGFS